MMTSLRLLRRRTFVKALSLGVAAPLALRMSRLAGAAAGARPTRLFIMYIPHGMPDEHFDPGTSLTLVKDGPRILDAIADNPPT